MTTHVIKSPVKTRVSMPGYAKLVGIPLDRWEGNCFAVASKLAPHFGGTAVYGHWLGEISPDAKFWASKRGTGFAQHGWIVLPDKHGKYSLDGEIVDPTRWSFEAKKPYLWKGKNDGAYDEGGNGFRMAMRGSRPPDVDDGREPVTIELGCEELYEKVRHICRMGPLTEFSDEYPFLYHADVAWLANTSPEKIGWFVVAEVYEAIAKAGCRGYIPIDNWKMVDRLCGLKDI
jgi:hypothetical protein